MTWHARVWVNGCREASPAFEDKSILLLEKDLENLSFVASELLAKKYPKIAFPLSIQGLPQGFEKILDSELEGGLVGIFGRLLALAHW